MRSIRPWTSTARVGWSRTQPTLHASLGLSCRGEVFDQPATLDTMLEEPDNATPGAAMGLFRQEIYGTTCWSHEGFWGTGVFTCPAVDLTISASVQQAALDDVDLNKILDAAFTLVPSD